MSLWLTPTVMWVCTLLRCRRAYISCAARYFAEALTAKTVHACGWYYRLPSACVPSVFGCMPARVNCCVSGRRLLRCNPRKGARCAYYATRNKWQCYSAIRMIYERVQQSIKDCHKLGSDYTQCKSYEVQHIRSRLECTGLYGRVQMGNFFSKSMTLIATLLSVVARGVADL